MSHTTNHKGNVIKLSPERCHFDEERGEIFAVQWLFKHRPRRFLASLEMT